MPTKKHVQSIISQADDLIFEHYNKLGPLPGLAVGIVHKGELVYTYNSGFADLNTRRPITSDTIFRIMSISKTFTAVALMQLWEQGKFQLDDPVNRHLKSIRVEHPDPNAPPVTIRHMLTHTSGVGELRTLKPEWLLKPQWLVITDLSVVDGERIPPLSEYYDGRLRAEVYPGIKYCYSNHAFGVLGQLVADLSGQPFEEYMTEHIFRPLGMNHSDWFLSDLVRDQLATGYMFQKDRFVPVADIVGYRHVMTAAASNIYSSVNDMTLYVAALMNGGRNKNGAILKPETLQMATTPQYQLDERLPAVGFSFFIRKIGEHRTIGHGGGWPGFISSMLVAPDDDLALLVFTNCSNGAPGTISADLMRRLLSEPEPEKLLPVPGVPEQPLYWSELVGSYGTLPGFNTNYRPWSGLGAELEVCIEGAQLKMRAPFGMLKDGVRLYAADKDDPLVFQALVMGSPRTIIFRRDPRTGYVDRMVQELEEWIKKPGEPLVPFGDVAHAAQTRLRRSWSWLVFWYLNGMPDKGRIALRAGFVAFLLWLLWPRRKA